jgi:hypothetical protein
LYSGERRATSPGRSYRDVVTESARLAAGPCETLSEETRELIET